MSVVAMVVDRDRRSIDRSLVERLLEALGIADAGDRSVAGWPGVALGVGRLPADGEQEIEPMRDRRSGLSLVFVGRLDNRRDLARTLGRPLGSDARLALAAYRKWGCGCFERLLGAFTVVIYDAVEHRVVCARDALGDRTLCYHLGAGQLAVASEPAALLRHPEVSSRLDELTLCRFVSVEPPLPGSTFFAEVRELPAGHWMSYEHGRLRLEPYWPPAALAPVRYRRDDEYVEHFRSLLEESVRCRLRAATPPAVLMSGGLDSTSVAALAARQLAESAPGARLRAISWVFDELAAADEREFIGPVIEHCGLISDPIVGDGEWPLRDLDSWPVSINAPWQGLYCRLQNRAYRRARRAGATVLLNGDFGDHLYFDPAFWLRDLLAERRFAESWRELRREAADRSPLALMRAGALRSAVVRAAGWRGRRTGERRWLTPYARRLLAGSRGATSPLRSRERGRDVPRALDPLNAFAAGLEVANAARAGIEVRRPYRDRRLIELMLSIPAHLRYRPGWTKWILRRAMRGDLPEPVRLRTHVSTLLPLAARGLAEREAVTVERLLGAPQARWQRYVRPEWLSATFPHRLRAGLDGIESAVSWQCLCLELWIRGPV